MLREDGEKLIVLFGSTQITLPSFTREALTFALSGQSFQVGDLPAPLDDPGKIVLAQRLIREGMLVRLNGRAAEDSAPGFATTEAAHRQPSIR
jgi:hypothetical protein